MRSLFFIFPAALIFQLAGAQNNGQVPLTISQGSFAAITVTASTEGALTDPISTPGSGDEYLDYKSVYEAATLEEEVQMAGERFNLTKSQQDVWMTAAVDRRAAEKQAYEKLNSSATDYNKDAVYKGLRYAHITFSEKIIGYLDPAQKHAIEVDRAILHEKQLRVAKLAPPPPPPVAAPVDSTLIKEQILKEAEKIKAAEKKSKKKKKSKA